MPNTGHRWHSLFFYWRLSNSVALLRAPSSGLGWIACIRRKASCTEPRCMYRDGSVRIHVPCHPYCLWILLSYIYIYIYAFSRRFYPKRLTLHYTWLYMCSLGIEPTTFALLTQCSTTEPQELGSWQWILTSLASTSTMMDAKEPGYANHLSS